MRETTASEIERINVIILLAGSAFSIIIMRNFTYFFSFAVASAIMILNFRYLRRIIEGFFSGSATAQTPAEEHQPGEEATKVSAISKGELLIRLPLKFAILIALIVVVLMWGHVNIPFFVIGLSTVFLSILISQVVVAFSPEAGGGNKMEHEQFTWVSVIPGLSSLAPHVANGIIVSVVLMVLVVLGYLQLRRTAEEVVPAEKMTFRNFVEILVEMVLGLVDGTMGPYGRRFMLIIGTLGIFILFNNLSGLVPGFQPATSNVNTTFACSLTVFVLTHYYGVRQHGIGYLKRFVGPIWWLAIIMIPIEIIGHISRPLSLGLRLFGNMMGDHLVTGIFFMLIPLAVPLVGMLLGTFVAFVQAYVFVLLSMTYFSGAIAEEH